jgi:signal transduction histidine kinase
MEESHASISQLARDDDYIPRCNPEVDLALPPERDAPAYDRSVPVNPPRTWIWDAITSPRYLVSPWPWRALAYVLTAAIGPVALAGPAVLCAAPFGTQVEKGDAALQHLLAGLLLTTLLFGALFFVVATPFARLDLLRARLVDPRALPRIVEDRRFAVRWRRRLTDRSAWVRVLYTMAALTITLPALLAVLLLGLYTAVLLAAPVLVARGAVPILLGPVAVTTMPWAWLASFAGVLLLCALLYLCGLLAAGQVVASRTLLGDPADALRTELVDVTRSRARLVHDFDAERRRIERDLHDGAQQQVVTLALRLGLARMELESRLGADDPVVRDVADAHQQAQELMAGLRAFIRGIYPNVLGDVGVGAAVEQLASTMHLPVHVRDHLDGRPAQHVESTLYFCAAEALTNVARHSGATLATVELRREDTQVILDICDDGHGGADPDRGTGLAGMVSRSAVIGGTVAVTSPQGGPTSVRVSVPDLPDGLPEEIPDGPSAGHRGGRL